MDTYLYAKKLPTLQYKLYEIMNQATMKMDVHAGTNVQTAVTPMSVRMAVTIVATVPIVIVYPFLCLLYTSQQQKRHIIDKHKLIIGMI